MDGKQSQISLLVVGGEVGNDGAQGYDATTTVLQAIASERQ
jgi:hypothetical protein